MNYFDEYTSAYDMTDPDINYKYYHSYRVKDAIEKIATKINLSHYDIELAKVIGLLHDIGRFEQDKLYDSFKDDKMDHGDYGVKVLKETNILDKTNIDSEDYEVVYKAVRNHNKYQIEPALTERELLFCKLVRDADKLDILYALGQEKYNVLRQDNEEISTDLENDYFNYKQGDIKKSNSSNDGLAIIFCYIYDINFKPSFEIIHKEKYYEKIYERINRKDLFKKYLEHANKYIEERID